MVVVIGDTEIVHPDGLRETDDPGLRVIARILTMLGVKMKIAFEPNAVAEAGNRRYKTELGGFPWIAMA
jgi:hypothetical protein